MTKYIRIMAVWLPNINVYEYGLERQGVYMSNIKQIIVYRRDLKMRKGKIAAQAAHASMAVFFHRATVSEHDINTIHITMTPEMGEWFRTAFTKIVLSVEDEESLLQAYAAAQKRGLPCALITDSGRTEFHGKPTHTAVAIGPAMAEDIDVITGKDGLVTTKLA